MKEKVIKEHWDKFEACILSANWAKARTYIAKEIDAEEEGLAKRMNDFYREHVCIWCNGEMRVCENPNVHVIFRTMRPCLCQKR